MSLKRYQCAKCGKVCINLTACIVHVRWCKKPSPADRAEAERKFARMTPDELYEMEHRLARPRKWDGEPRWISEHGLGEKT